MGRRRVIFEDYPIIGFNYRMTDIQAAVGRVQLGRLPGILERRIDLATRYTEAISEIVSLEPPLVPAGLRSNYQSYPVRVTPDFPISRDNLMKMLLERGISTGADHECPSGGGVLRYGGSFAAKLGNGAGRGHVVAALRQSDPGRSGIRDQPPADFPVRVIEPP